VDVIARGDGLYVIARGDGLCRQADGFAVLDDGLSQRDGSQRNLVTERHPVAQGQRQTIAVSNRRPDQQIDQGDSDVVILVEAEES
jgi:hypothetical protein